MAGQPVIIDRDSGHFHIEFRTDHHYGQRGALPLLNEAGFAGGTIEYRLIVIGEKVELGHEATV
jgi:hypothetical protein